MLNTAQTAKKPLEEVLWDLRLTPIRPNIPLPHEILHNWTFQHPGRPSQPVNMERVRNYLLSHKQVQSTQFNKAHGAHALPELTPGQEMLFRSPVDKEYIPRTIIVKPIVHHSYYVEAQGKRYHRTREHLWPIHPNLPPCTKSPTPTTPASGTHFPNSQAKPPV